MAAQHSKPSWRDRPKPRQNQAKTSVRTRRFLTTSIVTICLAGLAALIFYLATRPSEATKIVWLQSDERISSSLPPLGFNTETREGFSKLKSGARFMTLESGAASENFTDQIRKAIAKLEPRDVFVGIIRQHGIAVKGQPYLAMNSFLLPDDNEALKQVLPLADVLNEVGKHEGQSLVLLDWGSIEYDSRIGVGYNQFISAVNNLISDKKVPNRVWLFASHAEHQISQDQTLASGSGFTRFLSACADGLVGERKTLLPGTAMDLSGDKRYLNLADFANYVTRRVVETSNGEQRPVLMRGGTGVIQIANDDQTFVQALNVTIARMKDGQPVGLAAKKADDANKPADATKETAAAAPANEAPAAPQVTDDLWRLVEQWSKPDPELNGWSIAQIAPVAAKEISAHAVRLEARNLAGKEYKNDNIYRQENAAAIATILSEAATAEKKASEDFKRNEKTLHIFDKSQGAVDEQWLAALESLKAYRTLSIRLYDAAVLSNVLDALDIDNSLSDLIKKAVTTTEQWNAGWSKYVADSSSKSYESWSVYTSDLNQLNDQLNKKIAQLIDTAKTSSDKRWRLSDALLKTSLLTLEQRKQLRVAMQQNQASERADVSIKNVSLASQASASGAELNDLFDESLLRSLGGQINASEPGVVIRTNKFIRDNLKENNAVAELAWLFIDGRDLVNGQWHFNSDQSGYFSNQFPSLPKRPTIKPSWAIAVVEGSSPIEKLRFTDDKIKQVKLVLRSSGVPSPVKSISVQLVGLQGKVANAPGKFLTSKAIQIDQQEWNERVDISGSDHAFLFDFQPMSNLTGNESLAASFTVSFEDASLPPQTLRMPVFVLDKRPIELIVEEQVGLDGELRWETVQNSSDIVTLRPFAAHANPFRLSLRSKADVDLAATVEVYALQQRDGGQLRPLGRLKNDQGSLFVGLERVNVSSMKLIGKSDEVKLPAGGSEFVSLSSSRGAATATPPTAPAAPPAVPAPVGAADASFGLVAIVKQANSSNSFKTWLEYIPRDASEFLDVDARATDQRKIEMKVSLRDDAGNGKPDLVPVGFSAGEKIALDWVTWPWQKDNLSVNAKREIDLENTSVLFEAESPSILPQRIPLTISVDNNPRALIYLLDSRGLRRADPYEHSESYSVEKIELKVPEKGFVYNRDIYHIDAKSKPLNLNEMDAIFPGRIDEPVSVLLNIDNRSQSTSLEGYPGKFSFGPESGDKRSFFGDRRNQFSVELNDDGSANLGCSITDWTFEFDFRSATDIEAPLVFKDENGANHELATIVLDGTKPEITPKSAIPKGNVIVGSSIPFSFSVSDRSPIKEVSILATPVGGEPKPIKPSAPKISNQKKKRYVNEYSMNLKDVELPPPGKPLSISIKAIDHVGNETTHTFKEFLRVIEKPPANPAGNGEPAPPHKGNLKGVVKLSTGKVFDNKNLGDNIATIKELNKKVKLDGGNFQFEDIESGKYTIEAKVKYQGVEHVGQEPIELKKPEDWEKLIEISLKPKEDKE